MSVAPVAKILVNIISASANTDSRSSSNVDRNEGGGLILRQVQGKRNCAEATTYKKIKR